MLDTILKNGQIFDGSGKTPITTDLGIKDNIISEIGKIDSDKGKEVIDVDGLAISPGFVDMHTHSDFTLMVNGRAESQVHQGVTTEVVGQCGISCAPANNDKISCNTNIIIEVINQILRSEKLNDNDELHIVTAHPHRYEK